MKSGKSRSKSKLDDATRQKIGLLLEGGKYSLRDIARQTGVSVTTISNIDRSMKSASQNTGGDGRYSAEELWELWFYCKSQSDAPQIIADLAGVPVDEAKQMIRRWEGDA